ncbi:MAG: glycosyltransferase family 4 protein [Flavobacteriales bacterium]|jgi:glycosyltransferase involved in cell wall biosynthesis|nr:glycosyltransferase family 4 protein [Flavobacteriales bacterium]NCG29376.1 glycosyltransferase [Bacteroidota bacterium]MBT3963804.1 glycosyltransferase family 4 protein [Flavobacteriales bacterium]MBT4705415.1 glycosyltransferase family 4 protein [Flavobacteriales bacterium]MBT4929834.1 glycosyltransferase family 4 protein [Flavobacteriales bacterium]
MRIGFDAKRLFLNHSGLGNYSRTMVQAVADSFSEDEFILYTPRTTANHRTSPFLTGKFEIRTPGQIPSFMRSWWRSIHLGNVVKDHNIDVFHGLSNELPRSIKKGNCKSVVTIHDLIFLRFPEYYPRFDRSTYRRKVEQSLQDADAVVAISERTKQDILEYFDVDAEKLHVIYQGCDRSFHVQRTEEEIESVRQNHGINRPYLISVGTIEERKNQMELVKAFLESNLSESHDLVLVGKARKYANKISSLLSQHSNATTVKQLPNVSFKELPALLQGAELSVYPSKYEGFGLPVLESLVCGVPVIAKTGSCLEETGGDSARYYSDPNELPKLMESVVANSTLRNEMIALGKLHAEKFDNSLMAQNYHELYESLL